MWGQATATQALLDALLSEQADGALILCRGVPQSWKREGSRIVLRRMPVRGGRIDCTVTFGSRTQIELTGAVGGRRIVYEEAVVSVPEGERKCLFSS